MENNHDNFLEELTLDSHRITETFIQLAFECNNISDEKMLSTLKEISKNLTEMQAKINHQLRSAKM